MVWPVEVLELVVQLEVTLYKSLSEEVHILLELVIGLALDKITYYLDFEW